MADWRLACGWLAAGLRLVGWLVDFFIFFTLTEVSKDL